MEQAKLKNGFLDKKMSQKREMIKASKIEIFNLLYSFNKLSYKIIEEFVDKGVNEKDNYIFASFIQINKLYQSTVIMIEYGLSESFQILLRSMYDISFKLIYVLDNDENILKIKKSYYFEKQKTIKYIEEKKLVYLITKDKLSDIKLETDNYLKDNSGIKNIPDNKQICSILNLQKEYAYFRVLSSYTHFDAKVIDNINIYKEGGILLNASYDYTSSEEDGIRLIECLSLTLEKIINLYSRARFKEYNELVFIKDGLTKRILEQEK